MRAAFECRASDVHLTVGAPPIFRVNGELRAYGHERLHPEETEQMAKAVIPAPLWQQFQETGELDFSYGIAGVSRFRLNVFIHTASAPAAIERMIDVFPPAQQAQIRLQLASVLVAIIAQRLFPNRHKTGRTAALEILVNNAAVANLIRNEKEHQIINIMQTSRSLGMQTMEMSVKELAAAGRIDPLAAEVYLARERGDDGAV